MLLLISAVLSLLCAAETCSLYLYDQECQPECKEGRLRQTVNVHTSEPVFEGTSRGEISGLKLSGDPGCTFTFSCEENCFSNTHFGGGFEVQPYSFTFSIGSDGNDVVKTPKSDPDMVVFKMEDGSERGLQDMTGATVTVSPTPIGNCLELTPNRDACAKCESGYTPGRWSQTGTCRKCTCASGTPSASEFHKDPSEQTCNCDTCTAQGYCKSCKDGYEFDNSVQPHRERCKKKDYECPADLKIDNCLQQSYSCQVCEICEPGYTPGQWSAKGTCRKCNCRTNPGESDEECRCATCTAQGYCKSCKPGYDFDGAEPPHKERCKEPVGLCQGQCYAAHTTSWEKKCAFVQDPWIGSRPDYPCLGCPECGGASQAEEAIALADGNERLRKMNKQLLEVLTGLEEN